MTARESQWHETLVHRLAQMLIKLNAGESLQPELLADEFQVSVRTIQRDLNERFSYLPIIKTNGAYRLDAACLGRFSARDIERFARLTGTRSLFPALTTDFIRDIFDSRIQSTWRVEGHHYEDLSGSEAQFKQLERVILHTKKIAFQYRKPDGLHAYQDVNPYQLTNVKGIWYLMADDRGTLKTFAFTRISQLVPSDESFSPNPEFVDRARSAEGVWWREDQQTVILRVSPAVADYFRRRPLIAGQVIEQDSDEDGLTIRVEVGHVNQVLPIVRYWIPHVHIIEPVHLHERLLSELMEYARQFSGHA